MTEVFLSFVVHVVFVSLTRMNVLWAMRALEDTVCDAVRCGAIQYDGNASSNLPDLVARSKQLNFCRAFTPLTVSKNLSIPTVASNTMRFHLASYHCHETRISSSSSSYRVGYDIETRSTLTKAISQWLSQNSFETHMRENEARKVHCTPLPLYITVSGISQMAMI